jgi:hypothetical protein
LADIREVLLPALETASRRWPARSRPTCVRRSPRSGRATRRPGAVRLFDGAALAAVPMLAGGAGGTARRRWPSPTTAGGAADGGARARREHGVRARRAGALRRSARRARARSGSFRRCRARGGRGRVGGVGGWSGSAG